MDPSVVIVIPCESVNAYVLECLRACLRLEYGNYRVVLLPDRQVSIPDDIRSCAVTVVVTGGVTIGAKRNIAIAAFPDANYYALIDSDAFPRADWLRKGIATFGATGAWAVGGAAISPLVEPPDEKAVGNATRSIMVSGNLAFSKNQGPGRVCRNLHSCNLILSRAAIEAVGAFNEHLLTGEDRELCHRIGRRGGTIYFDGSVVVYHHNRKLMGRFLAQRFVHGHSIYAIALHDRVRENVFLFAPVAAAAAFLACFLWGISDPTGWLFCGAALGVYVLAALFESVRHSGALPEVPLTFAAIITSNVGYVLGAAAGLAGAAIDFKRLYRNHPGPARPGA